MERRSYLRLPISADEGFPQAFRLTFGRQTYRVSLYVNAPETEAEPPLDHVYDLPDLESGAFMVMRVVREGAGEPDVIFQRKLVRDLEYEAAELAFVFHDMKVAKRNLHGIGAFGSRVVGGVAARWAS